MKITTWVDIFESGKKVTHNRDKFKDALENLRPGRYIYTIEKVENKRSLDQNNAMWGIPYEFFRLALIESGEFKDPSKHQIHEWCMYYFLPEDYKERIRKEWEEQEPMIDRRTGEVFKTAFRLTTTKMTTIDAMHYYENKQNGYAEFFSNDETDLIPDPDPLKKRK